MVSGWHYAESSRKFINKPQSFNPTPTKTSRVSSKVAVAQKAPLEERHKICATISASDLQKPKALFYVSFF